MTLPVSPSQLASHQVGAAKPTKPVEAVIPEKIRQLLGKPALLPGEDPAHYEELLKQVVLCIDPKNILEWLWVKDIVDCSFDTLRYQRFKPAVIGLGRRHAVRTVVGKSIHENRHKDHLNRLTDGFFSGDQAVRKELQGIFAQLSLTEDCINAQAMIEASSDVAKIDALEGSASSRRNTAVREIERGRQQLLVAAKDDPDVIEVVPDDSEKTS